MSISFKKFTIQTIANPGRFYAYESEKEIKRETKLNLLQKSVTKFEDIREISVGQIVAVKHENGFHRGLVTDIYNRCMRTICCIWLVDHGNNIETAADSLFMIKDCELRSRTLSAFEIIIHGIQPVAIELLVSSVDLEDNINRGNLSGILHKRESDNWSPAAYKFVKDLFNSNKHVYVNCYKVNGSTIMGDIYYNHKDDNMLTSLAQTLCDNDFAVFSQVEEDIPLFNNYQGKKYLNNIDRRIPNIAKTVEWEELSVTNSCFRPARQKSSSGNSSGFSECNKSFSSNSDKFLNSERRSSALGTSNFSPSWVLKKLVDCSPSTSSESFKSSCQNIQQAEKMAPSPKVSLLRIIERNLELHDKHK